MNRFIRPVVIILASVLLVGLAARLLYRFADVQELADRYFEPYPDLLSDELYSPRAGQINIMHVSTLQESIWAFNKGNFSLAQKGFEAFTTTNRDTFFQRYTDFYLGQTYWLTKDYLLAKERLTQAMQQGEPLETPARWYLALTLIKLEELEAAKSQLSRLSGEGPYREKARRLERAFP